MNLIWKIHTVYNKILSLPRVYALSIERPTSREKANDKFTSQLRGQSCVRGGA